jgi:hypothetical protein
MFVHDPKRIRHGMLKKKREDSGDGFANMLAVLVTHPKHNDPSVILRRIRANIREPRVERYQDALLLSAYLCNAGIRLPTEALRCG